MRVRIPPLLQDFLTTQRDENNQTHRPGASDRRSTDKPCSGLVLPFVLPHHRPSRGSLPVRQGTRQTRHIQGGITLEGLLDNERWFVYDYYCAAGRPKMEDALMDKALEMK